MQCSSIPLDVYIGKHLMLGAASCFVSYLTKLYYNRKSVSVPAGRWMPGRLEGVIYITEDDLKVA